MTTDQLNLLREWIRAEIALAIQDSKSGLPPQLSPDFYSRLRSGTRIVEGSVARAIEEEPGRLFGEIIESFKTPHESEQ